MKVARNIKVSITIAYTYFTENSAILSTETKENEPTKTCTSCQHLQTEMQQLSSAVQQRLQHFCVQIQNVTKQSADETVDATTLRTALSTIGDAVGSVLNTLITDDGLFLSSYLPHLMYHTSLSLFIINMSDTHIRKHTTVSNKLFITVVVFVLKTLLNILNLRIQE